jgi:hypothetical protein
MVGVFREEWPAADCNLRQAAGDRIASISECFAGRQIVNLEKLVQESFSYFATTVDERWLSPASRR